MDHTLTIPTETKLAMFVPLKDFFCPEFQTSYVCGMEYWLRAGNDRLAAAAEKWQEDGLIVIEPLEETT